MSLALTFNVKQYEQMPDSHISLVSEILFHLLALVEGAF